MVVTLSYQGAGGLCVRGGENNSFIPLIVRTAGCVSERGLLFYKDSYKAVPCSRFALETGIGVDGLFSNWQNFRSQIARFHDELPRSGSSGVARGRTWRNTRCGRRT